MAVCNTNRAMAARQTNGFRDSQKSLDYTTWNHAAKEEINAFLINEDELHQIDDLTKVNPITTVTVLKCLQARYAAGSFYTNAGCTLVSLNPFQSVPSLYSSEVMKEYHNVTRPQDLKPHIFVVAEQAFRNVQSHIEPINQSLIVSGESGAGKTWTSRCLMNYFATVAASNSSIKCQENVERIEKRVLDSNPVMEAFGNASTLRNHNSSRFGKYIQLHLNRSQQLQGASVQTYLLEKTRVAYQAPHERNFHIFYQIVKGATEKQKSEWGLSEATEFFWLPNSEKVLEEKQFAETKNAMLHLGIDHATQLNVFRILVGLLHLGNVQFSSAVDDSYPCDLKAEAKSFLSITANLLKISEEDLLEQIRIRTIIAGRQQQIFKKPCSKMECETRKDCVAKVIYAKLFDWLVNVINGSICTHSFGWTNFIGLLDVYGFESFPQNNLEQLCINYANEKLQQHFVAHYLKAQQEEYTSEGLEWSFVNYQDNQRCLDLIEGSPTSIFSLLNEESRLNRSSDENQFKTRLQTTLANNHCLSWDVFSKVPNFIVAHYAGKVNYQIEGMLEKNKDPVPPELVQLLQTSQDALLMELFPFEGKEHNDTKVQNKAYTVVSKFKGSLESLMHILNSTTPHYIRCIKPNMDCKPFLFRSEEIFTQLEACGLVETVSISAAGFPIRVPYQHFLERYGLLGKYSQAKSQSIPSINGCFFTKKQKGALLTDGSSETLQSTVQDILTNVLAGQSVSSFQNPAVNGLCHTKVHCGKTKLFMTHNMLELLESARIQTLSNKALCIQHSWHKYCQRKLARSSRAATIIQAAIRSWLTRRWIKKLHHSAMVLQRMWKARKIKMETLAEKELDNPTNFNDMELIPGSTSSSLSPLRHELLKKCSQSIPFQNLKLRSWPLGLILSPFCITGIALSAFEFLKACTRLAALKVKWSNTHKLEHNQCHRGIASIRALPEVQVKFHCKRSPLLFADTYPEHQKCMIIGFNQILLEKV